MQQQQQSRSLYFQRAEENNFAQTSKILINLSPRKYMQASGAQKTSLQDSRVAF